MKIPAVLMTTLTILVANVAPGSNYPGSKTKVEYVQPDGGNPFYAFSTTSFDIGTAYNSDTHQTETTRAKFTFDLTNIPSNATINSISLSYTMTDYGNSGYHFKVTQCGNYSSAQDIYQHIGSGTVVFSDIGYGSSSIDNSSLNTLVANNKGGYLYLGAYSQDELHSDSWAFLDITLNIDWTAPPANVTITAQNNFTGGTILVDGYQRSSPYQFSKQVGSGCTLEAQEQNDPQGYYKVWASSVPNSPSIWYKNGSAISGSTSIQYTFTVATGDNNATYTAGLRRRFNISRSDQTEFDGTQSAGVVAQIVENNSGSVSAPSTETVNSHSYQYRQWSDDVTSNPRTVSPTDNMTLTAVYKGVHLSSASNALSNTSQRKAIRTDEGYVFLAYESSSRVWLERSTDEGGTWTVVNGGQPIDAGPAAKLPSLDYLTDVDFYEQNNELYVTYQQQTANGHYTIQVARFDGSGTKLSDRTIYTSASSYSNDATPVIAVTWYYRGEWRKQMVGIWKEPASTGVNAGLYWYPAYYLGSTFYWNDVPQYYQIQNTGSASVNPTIDVFKYDGTARYGGTMYYPFAWEENGTSIKYGKVTCGYSGLGNSGILTSVSYFFSANYRPSIIAYSNTDYRLAWNAYLDNPDDTPPIAMLTNPVSPSTYWSYSSYVTSVTLNKYLNDLDWTVGYAIGWTRNSGSGYSNYAVKSTNLNSSLSLNSTGKDMQLHNGWGFSTMHGVTLGTSSPYAFQRTGNVNNGQIPKTTDTQFGSGRTVVASFDGVDPRFYFTVGDVFSSGNAIDFPALSDTTNATTTQQLLGQLVSEPFAVGTGADLTFGIEYGVTDSVAASLSLKGGNFVGFKLDLIDAQTSRVVGTVEQVKYDSSHIVKYGRIDEIAGAKAVGNHNVRLRLSIVSNLTPQLAIGSILAPSGPVLFKKGAVRRQTDLTLSNVVTQYGLSHNYPNPFNPSTQISYQLPAKAYVNLKVFDILGREVAILVDEIKESGAYTALFDGSGLSSGVYLTKMVCKPFDGGKAFVQSKKIVLMK